MGLKGIGLISDDVPKTKNVLNMFDPIIFPTTKSSFFLNRATRETTNSGREVPTASSVAEIRVMPWIKPEGELISCKNKEVIIKEGINGNC